jgi:hypothetical protein
MKDRRDYEQALAIVRSAIGAWDPYRLLELGAPPDEFDDEIAKVVARIPKLRGENDLAATISEVFSSAFGPETFAVADCAVPARLAFTGLVNAKLWPTA